MKRLKPDPIPAIHPLPEYAATGALRASYEDTKAVLGVPWMGVVTMAFAHYPTFWDTLWTGVRPICATPDFHTACTRIRTVAEDGAETFSPTPLGAEMAAGGYGAREIAEIAQIVEVFSAGNMPYLLIASLARYLLEGGETDGAQTGGAAPDTAPAPVSAARLILMEAHHAEAPTRALYDEIKTTLGLPFVNTDYRALARWPSYFRRAWAELAPHVATAPYEVALARVHDEATRLVRALPNPSGLTGEALRAAAARDATLGEVRDVVRLFQWLLPGLVTNVAFFRAQLPPG